MHSWHPILSECAAHTGTIEFEYPNALLQIFKAKFGKITRHATIWERIYFYTQPFWAHDLLDTRPLGYATFLDTRPFVQRVLLGTQPFSTRDLLGTRPFGNAFLGGKDRLGTRCSWARVTRPFGHVIFLGTRQFGHDTFLGTRPFEHATYGHATFCG